MATVHEFAEFDAVGLAALIRDGKASAAEVHTAAVAAAAELDEVLGALTEGPFNSQSRANPNGEFYGVPFVAKDLVMQIKDVPTHAGSAALADAAPATADSILMSRFRAAGLNLIATASSSEFGLSVATDQKWRGPTRNPWDLNKGPGGSSGGSAALVAAGVVPIAHANDGAGSIRIPAGHTGLVGLKPSRGRVPLGPQLQELMYGNGVEFAVTRTVRDTAHLLDLIHGDAPGEKYGAPSPRRSFRDEVAEGSGEAARPLRIAASTSTWTGQLLERDVEQAVENTAKLLTEMGHVVEWHDPRLDWDDFVEAMAVTWSAGTAAAIVPLLESGCDPEAFEATTMTLAEWGRSLTPVDLEGAFATNNRISRCFGQFHRSWDIWLTPICLRTAYPVGSFDADNASYSSFEWVRKCIAAYPTVALSNVTGMPGIALPLAESSNGLPIGIHFGAGLYREDVLIRLGAELERAIPWADRRPPVHVSSL